MKKQLDNISEHFDPSAYLKELHTKQLMQLRDKIYKITPQKDSNLHFSSEHEMYLHSINSEPKYDVSNSFKEWYVTLNDVRRELKTREHIPNKEEAKEIRQQRAKHKNK